MKPPTYELGPDSYEKLGRPGSDLSSELRRIDAFVERARHESPGRDAHELRLTPRATYEAEARAFHALNAAWRERFNATRHTLVVLPDCITLHNPDCRKVDRRGGGRCARCVPHCLGARASVLAQAHGATVVFAHRETEAMLRWHQRRHPDLGVVGVACILMLAEGMRTAAALGIPPRGVLLDGCGCEHWNDEPFASTFAFARLDAILAEKAPTAGSAPRRPRPRAGWEAR